MTLLVASGCAAGLLLVVFGLPPLRRPGLEERIDTYLSGLHGRPSSLLAAHPTLPSFAGWLEKALGRFLPRGDDALEDRLRAAGSATSPGGFRIEQLTWGAAAALGVWGPLALGYIASLAIDVRVVPALSGIAFASGWFGRDWWLTKQIGGRRGALQEELPAAIDLVTLSIMAGESVPAAFARVGKIVVTGIGAEFQSVVADVRAGATTVEALEGMKQRVPGPGVSRFVDALVTGVERGAPLADVLRAQADDGRDARRRALMEMGGRREVLMLVPVVFLIMPTVVAFALYPGLVSLDLLVP